MKELTEVVLKIRNGVAREVLVAALEFYRDFNGDTILDELPTTMNDIRKLENDLQCQPHAVEQKLIDGRKQFESQFQRAIEIELLLSQLGSQ